MEALGFLLTPAMIRDLLKVDLMANRQKPVNHMLFIESDDRVSQKRSYEHFNQTDSHVDYQCHPSQELWIWKEDYGAGLVPQFIVQPAVSWIAGVYP